MNDLTGWRKLLQASPGRPTRFHTLKGDLMPADAWLRLPLTLMERLIPPQRPWLVPSSIRQLERLIEPHWRVLELGAGASTAWFEQRCAYLLSLETQKDWYERLKPRTACDLRLVEEPELESFLRALNEVFDLVIVDFLGDRTRVLAAAAGLVRPGGYLLLDNSDANYTAGADDFLEGWAVQRFLGVLPGRRAGSADARSLPGQSTGVTFHRDCLSCKV
jgi:hypothetical protein